MDIIVVGVEPARDLFWSGVSAYLGNDQTLILVELPDPVASLHVAVVTPNTAVAGDLDCPLVVCLGQGDTMAQPALTVAATLAWRTLTPARLAGAVRAAAAGLRVVDMDRPEDPLDNRDRAVLNLLASGATTAEISDELAFSQRTIKQVIADIEHRLGARSRAHAVATALRLDLI